MFNVEPYAIFGALKAFDQGQERNRNYRRYTIFADSTASIDRARSDALGPGQQWARAAIEVCSCIMSKDNEVTILWVPAHSGIEGNEEAD